MVHFVRSKVCYTYTRFSAYIPAFSFDFQFIKKKKLKKSYIMPQVGLYYVSSHFTFVHIILSLHGFYVSSLRQCHTFTSIYHNFSFLFIHDDTDDDNSNTNNRSSYIRWYEQWTKKNKYKDKEHEKQWTYK